MASVEADVRVAEVPYNFRNRMHGESKLDSLVLWEYGILLLDKMVGHIIPPRFILFALVGATGVAIHFAVLSAMLNIAGRGFIASQTAATFVAMTTNFVLNDALTYRDKRLHGWRFVTGLLSFYAVCGLGALANVGIAGALFNNHYTWWLAAGAGVLVGTVFNYALTSLFTWNRR
jgi:dolichol-phosphate mannosyltransferase